jgi:hypothetical protein
MRPQSQQDANVSAFGVSGVRTPVVRTAEISRIHSVSLASRYADLSIFRSPGIRQIHGNRNQFDADKLGWKPTKLAGKKKERFQYPADLVVQSKFNQIMTSGSRW